MSQLYGMVCNPNYMIGKPLPYPNVYIFLSNKTMILESCGITYSGAEKDDSAVPEKTKLQVGNKAAKEALEKKAARKDDIQQAPPTWPRLLQGLGRSSERRRREKKI